jgi:hypothetical protein
VLWYTLSEKECRKVIGEVVAVVGPEIVCLGVAGISYYSNTDGSKTYLRSVNLLEGIQILHNHIDRQVCRSQLDYLYRLAQVGAPWIQGLNPPIINVL